MDYREIASMLANQGNIESAIKTIKKAVELESDKRFQVYENSEAIIKSICNYINQNINLWSHESTSAISEFIEQIESDSQETNILKQLLAKSNYKFIRLENISKSEEDVLKAANIKLKHLKSTFGLAQLEKNALQKFFWKFNQKITKHTSKEKSNKRYYTAKILRKYQEKALFNKSLSVVCPCTGSLINSIHSFPMGKVIFYRFEAKKVFYLASFAVAWGYKIDSIYFPDCELIVFSKVYVSPESRLKKFIDELKFLLLTNLKSTELYLSNSKPKRVGITIGHENFAHHLLNELEAIQRLDKNGYFGKIDDFWVTHEPLGPLEEIFPEIAANKVKRVDNNSDMLRDVLNSHSFVVKIGDSYISDLLRNRVYKVAINNCNSKFLESVYNAKEKCFPLLAISIRIANRTCINQVDVLAKIISKLALSYPKLGVVFDGFSLPADFHCSKGYIKYDPIHFNDNNIYGIRQIINNVIKKVDDKSVIFFDAAKCTLFESNGWANNIDFFLSPHGTIQHKFGWLANKPGVVHSNSKVLSNPNYPDEVGEWVNSRNAIYLSKEAVIDYEIPAQFKDDMRKDLNNYYLKWEEVYKVLLKLSLSLPKRKTTNI